MNWSFLRWVRRLNLEESQRIVKCNLQFFFLHRCELGKARNSWKKMPLKINIYFLNYYRLLHFAYIYIYIYILYVSSITEGRQMSCRTLRNNFYNCHWCVYTLCSPIFSHTVLFPNGSQNFLKKFQRFFGPSPFSTRYSLPLFEFC